MPYKEYKPDSTEKITIDEIEFEIHKFTDGDNIYWCGKCLMLCQPEFFYVNDCALCSEKCKEEYLEEIRETQKNAKPMQEAFDKQLEDQFKKQQKAQVATNTKKGKVSKAKTRTKPKTAKP